MNVIFKILLYMGKLEEKIRTGQVLSAAEQVSIVVHKDKKYLRLYIEKHCLCDKAEVALVKLCDEDLLRLYLKNNGLCPEAEEQLLETRDFKLLQLYFNEYGIPGFSPRELLKEHFNKKRKF